MSLVVPLGKDMFALLSDEDEDLAGLDWHAHKGKGDYYYASRRFYIDSETRIREWLHTEVLERVIQRQLKKGELADHINGDKLDNRRENLRLATRSQNEMNKRKRVFTQKPTSSSYKGVSWMKSRNKWRAVIQVNGKQKSLGTFPGTPEGEREAAKAYNKAAEIHYGEFAHLNEL